MYVKRLELNNWLRYRGKHRLDLAPTMFGIVGERFGKYVVLRRDTGRADGRTSFWLCRCECDRVKSVQEAALLGGTSMSCMKCRPPEKCGGRPKGSKSVGEPAKKRKTIVDVVRLPDGSL